jgi:hypothetical protein
MGTFLKYLVILVILGAAALYGYSYLLTSDPAPVVTPVQINVE